MKIVVYSTSSCPICDKTKTVLDKWQRVYEVKAVDTNKDNLKEMLSISNNARTVPQISIDDKWIGGFSELTELHMDGFFDN